LKYPKLTIKMDDGITVVKPIKGTFEFERWTFAICGKAGSWDVFEMKSGKQVIDKAKTKKKAEELALEKMNGKKQAQQKPEDDIPKAKPEQPKAEAPKQETKKEEKMELHVNVHVYREIPGSIKEGFYIVWREYNGVPIHRELRGKKVIGNLRPFFKYEGVKDELRKLLGAAKAKGYVVNKYEDMTNNKSMGNLNYKVARTLWNKPIEYIKKAKELKLA